MILWMSSAVIGNVDDSNVSDYANAKWKKSFWEYSARVNGESVAQNQQFFFVDATT